MPSPKKGAVAPPIVLATDTGEMFDLASLRGRNVALFFYPKADTPGCTLEAREFRDAHEKFGGTDTVIIGISPDKPDKQAKFKKRWDLPYTLLADVDHKVAEAYGVWVQKSMMGKKYMGVARTTFLIDKEGRIAHVFEKVKPVGHANEVYEVCSVGS
jgi:thioredoxin-dependent peroxiredoxin